MYKLNSDNYCVYWCHYDHDAFSHDNDTLKWIDYT